jgi:hypothetical protein
MVAERSGQRAEHLRFDVERPGQHLRAESPPPAWFEQARQPGVRGWS